MHVIYKGLPKLWVYHIVGYLGNESRDGGEYALVFYYRGNCGNVGFLGENLRGFFMSMMEFDVSLIV